MREIEREKKEKPFGRQDIVLILLGSLYIFLFCWIGSYARPSADDYNFFEAVSDSGFIEVQKSYYCQWTGRVFNTFLLSLVASLDANSFYGLLPLGAVLLSIIALHFCLGALVPGVSVCDKMVFVLLLQAAMLSVLPALNETLYWLSGMPYTWATVVALFALALAVKALRQNEIGPAFWSCSVLLFLNGTLLEPISVMQILLASLAVLYFSCLGEAVKARRAVFFFFAALLAFLVMLVAPGTAIRMGKIATVAFLPRFFRTLGIAVVFGFFTVVKFFMNPIMYVFLLFLPSITRNVPSFDEGVARRLRAWHIGLITALTALLMQAIAGWGTGAGLPGRAESLTLWLMGTAWFLLWSFGYRQKKTLERIRTLSLFRWRWVLLGLCLLLSPNFVALIEDLRIVSVYRAELELREELLTRQREMGRMDTVVPLLTARPKLLFFTDLRPWPSDWRNQSYAKYHGVETVRALPSQLILQDDTTPDVRQKTLGGIEKLAEAGDAQLQFLMGEMYDTTFALMDGVEKDDGRAAAWYARAAEQGDVHAQRRLTRLYATGNGVPRSYSRAIYWLARSQF
ncbi:DUF6056 family protein [uncultured Fretibacterium sp.]|uniref:DUF6056 family protein n=1 Tax=uncultured Fretibacterium sp. TaxID=1678694 RepID=UPI00325FBED8